MNAFAPGALGVRAVAAYNVYRFMRLRVRGSEFLPSRGPALIAARHYHHLLDGAALVHALRRQPHLFVALDWTTSLPQRYGMEFLCRLAGWPVALRADAMQIGGCQAYAGVDVSRYVRRAIAESAALLVRNQIVAIFPEAYPTIDPVRSRKTGDAEILPFRGGMLSIVALAQRNGAAPIPIVPAGFAYARRQTKYDVTLRLGAPLWMDGSRTRAQLLCELRARVMELSR